MRSEQQYIDLFAGCEDMICRNSAPAMNALRARALADFERLGFLSTKSEDYKYTDVDQAFAPDYGLNINRLAIPVNPYDVFRCDVPNLSTSLYFVVNDSFYDKELPKAHLPEGVYAGGLRMFAERYPAIATRYYGKAASSDKDGIIALNTMLAQDGFVVYVPEGVEVERPIQLVNIFRSDVDTMANRRILVIMEPRSRARLLVCDHSIDDVKFLAMQVVEIFAGEGAYEEFKKLATVFYGGGPGLLIHPVWQSANAFFTSLKLEQAPLPDYVRYSFTFHEHYDGYHEELESGTSSGSEALSSEYSEPAYTVVSGDTLWGIAANYGVSLDSLLEANPSIKNPNLIHVGDQVVIPC